MTFLPFQVTEYNDMKADNIVTLISDTGTLWVRVGKLDIEIKQTDDGRGVNISALDAELCEQDLGTIEVLFENILELPKD